MTKNILMPVDVSQMDAAAAAIGFARLNMNIDDARFLVLNVVAHIPAYVTAEIPEAALGKARDEIRAELSALLERENLVANAEIIIRDGSPGREILDYAGEVSPDVILISSHDPGLADYFLGSVAAHLVRHAHCSVIVVRNPTNR